MFSLPTITGVIKPTQKGEIKPGKFEPVFDTIRTPKRTIDFLRSLNNRSYLYKVLCHTMAYLHGELVPDPNG